MTARKSSGWGGYRPGAGQKRIIQSPGRISLLMEKSEIRQLKKLAREKDVSLAEFVRATLKARIKRRS